VPEEGAVVHNLVRARRELPTEMLERAEDDSALGAGTTAVVLQLHDAASTRAEAIGAAEHATQ
jgi:hypothetical protein